ncbi:MAG: hypothetical protein VX583_00660 [Bdellovibrionota bacterium]|nr:hypothetical protein [Pseudobdellovibrionaceae bacterium]|tara:strand:+ start:218034 stop:219389 length:1356 start_codon:yes stop_codon:yes gene_type:complete
MRFFLFVILIMPVILKAELKYCVPVDEFKFQAGREITDGKDLAYLMTVFRSFISKTAEPGIIQKYNFSPNGKVFRAQINSTLKWSNGDKIKVEEVAYYFYVNLINRSIGERVRLKDKAPINDASKVFSNSSFKKIDELTFEVQLESEIKNLTGVLLEALSTGSRQNRFWMADLNSKENRFVSRYPILNYDSKSVLMKVKGHDLRLVSKSKCQKADFGIYPNFFVDNFEDYDVIETPVQQAITAVINTKLPVKKREQIVRMLKSAFDKNSPRNILPVYTFFRIGEPGYQKNLVFDSLLKIKEKKSKESRFKVYFEIPIFKEIIQKECSRCEFISAGSKKIKDADVQVLSSAIFGGRHVILQDLLKWDHIDDFLKFAPKSVSGLKEIARLSAATIPPDNKTLRDFETSIRDEVSIFPIGRRLIIAYSKKGTPFFLSFNSYGEMFFHEKLELIK